MVSNKNILVAQGGGPTNVINQSLVGIIQQENNYKSKILGSINGVNGIINNRFISLNKISDNGENPRFSSIFSVYICFFETFVLKRF